MRSANHTLYPAMDASFFKFQFFFIMMDRNVYQSCLVFGKAGAVISVMALIMVILIFLCFLYWKTMPADKKAGNIWPPHCCR